MGIQQTGIHLEKDKAFITLFNLHWNNVYRLCKHYAGDEAVAKDLTQEIFLSVYERKISFDCEQHAGQYLAKAARYRVLNYLRDEKRADSIETEDPVETNRYNPETVYMATELQNRLTLQVSNLPEPSRTMFLLSREQEMSYRQIADQLGIAVKTVEKHMSRALRLLKTSQ